MHEHVWVHTFLDLKRKTMHYFPLYLGYLSQHDEFQVLHTLLVTGFYYFKSTFNTSKNVFETVSNYVAQASLEPAVLHTFLLLSLSTL